MSLNLNKVILCGRLTADPELKQTQSGVSVLSFTLAVDRGFRAKSENGPSADFISIVAWRQTAEFISKYFSKGSSICVVGSIQTRSWENQKGEKHFATEVIAEEAMFAGVKEEYRRPQAEQEQAPAPKEEKIPEGEQMKMNPTPRWASANDEDLPF